VARCVLALGPDCAGTVLSELVAGARSRLDAAVYEVGPSYAVQLVRAAARGVRVRLLLDAHAGANSTSTRLVHGGGVACRVLGGHPGVEAHWKVLIADGARLAVGSGNLLHRDAPAPGQPGTREWWVAVSGAPRLLRTAADLVDTAWAEATDPPLAWRRAAVAAPAPPPVGVPQPAVPPLHLDVPARALHLAAGGEEVAALLAERIAAARRRVLVTVPYVHSGVPAVRALLDALVAAARRGATVRVLLGTPPEPAAAEAVRAIPLISVRVMDPARSTTGHAKGLVADGVAVAGSANWSGAGLGGNREAALSLDDARAAGWFAAALSRDWEASSPL